MLGWILDLHPGKPGEMVVWFRRDDGRTVRLVDAWHHSIFIAADTRADLSIPLRAVRHDLASTKEVMKYERITDQEKSPVVEAKVGDVTKVRQVAERIERFGEFGEYRLYNVDVPSAQSYLYEHDLFPLARCEVREYGNRLDWSVQDSELDYDYPVPDLKRLHVDVDIAKEGKLARLTDRIRTIKLDDAVIDGGSEADKLLGLVEAVRRADPDFLVTNDGDTFLFPFLIARARANRVAGQFTLSRDGSPMTLPIKSGTSYFSYGKVHYKPSAIKLKGRMHIDVNTSFAYFEAGFDGLFELSRLCRMPLQTSSRATIGKALSSLQFYHAYRRDLLVPWKPVLTEYFKDRNELLLADRGGLVLEPIMGVHEGVGELDFHALYPSIMYEKNISAETVRCRCCPDSKQRVPELGWNICERRLGIVPSAIEVVVEKRQGYKETRAAGADLERDRARRAVLKWIGVCSFGYLGFNNAKFGRIDAHIAVCAWDRKILTDAAGVAEGRGFRVVHGIVDSLWVKKEGAGRDEYLELKSEIEERTGFEMSFERSYKWVAFLPSKTDARIPVLNRYFGVSQEGELKVRGIEARRHDTPPAFKKCQMAMLTILAGADTAAEARAMVPGCVDVFHEYADAVEQRRLSPTELAFTTDLSKPPDEHGNMTVQSAAARQLAREGAQLHAGEGIRYVVTNYRGRDSLRAAPLEFADAQNYDTRRYVELLAEVCASVLKPFDSGCSRDCLLRFRSWRRGPLA